MNELSQEEFIAQVGTFGRREITQLAEWLLTTESDQPHHLDLTCRYAPSIITQSELGVFGLSDPRFAIRLYLESGGSRSLINVRRIQRMRSADPRWGRRLRWLRRFSTEPLRALPTPKNRPRELLRTASRIADCLLQPPKRLGNGRWTVLKADLGREYGETLRAGDFLGTPYLKHIPLAGGGLCAQAVCFMATSLLHEHATGIHGLLEITALAQRNELERSEKDGHDVYEMQISGLNYGGMTRYFRETDLRAIKQKPKTLSYARPGATWSSRNDCFTAAARAYLKSGMPIILTVDLGRLAAPAHRESQLKSGLERPTARPIYARNNYAHPGFEKADKGQFQKRRDHAVLLVGCRKEEGSEMFLVNDPASLPFLEASTGQLADAGYYPSEWDGENKTRRDDFGSLKSLHVMPVTPAAVKLPLLWWLPDDEVDFEDEERPRVEHWRDGLFAIIPVMQSGAVSIGRQRLPYVAASQRFRDFRLLRFRNLEKTCEEFFEPEGESPDLIGIRRMLRDRSGWDEDHWLWLQLVREPLSLWIFDAERELPADDRTWGGDARMGFLRAGVWREGAQWNEVFPPGLTQAVREKQPETISASEGRPGKKPEPAMVTSFSLLGFRDALKSMPRGLRNVELYAFMREDLKDLASNEAKDRPVNEWLASLNHKPEEVRVVAGRLVAMADEAGVSIRALAAFLPEIAAADMKHAGRAVAALTVLVRLCEIMDGAENHAPRTIRTVAGNRIRGIWPARLLKKGDGRTVFMANVISRERLGRILLSNLGSVADKMDPGSPVRVALELEPGPLNLLNDWDSLCWFAEHLEKSPWSAKPGRRAGFNLNVAHWAFLAGIRPEQLEDGPVRERVLNAHVADQNKGHFSDQALGVFHDSEAFRPWIDLMCDLAAEERPPLSEFSGLAAVELEACGSESLLETSAGLLQVWLKS